ncbi:MAG: 3-hydroxybutyrate oligomer hydrolase family protein [Paracoccaceae bacterium]
MTVRSTRRAAATMGVAAALLAIPVEAAAERRVPLHRLPADIGDIASWTRYDGVTDDLLTAGLGKTGLAGPAPAFADPSNPTPAELRRLAIYNNYRALLDMTEGGGYGRLYGPNIDADGEDTLGEGLVAGIEVIAYADAPRRFGLRRAGGRERPGANVTVMVQVPDGFDPDAPCIVTGPSSGSRGVYGAIATSGEWGLKNGCAVAYTDKGTGTGAHDLDADTVGLIDGLREDAEVAGAASTFTAPLFDRIQEAYVARNPHRWAFKHAHSQRNPEARWGENVLTSIEFAFHVLHELHEEHRFTPENTIVIASSISNGGGASVLAAERDRRGLIDAIAVSEPNVNPRFDPRFAIVQGDGAPFFEHSRSLNEYYSVLNLYLGCAALAPENAAAPFNFAPSAERCASLADLGLIEGASLAEQATDAQARINAAGFLPEQNILAPSHWAIDVPQAIGVTYANAYGRFSVVRDACGYSVAAIDPATNAPAPLGAAAEAALFATSNGIPPTGGVQLIAEDSVGGPVEVSAGVSPTTGRADQYLEGQLCLRRLAIGRDPVTGRGLRGFERLQSERVRRGVREIRADGDLGGLPAIFVTGRADAILPPNHTSRAYFGLNRLVEGSASGLTYVEITNAQHLDTLNGLVDFGFADLYIPLHHYYIQALDLMFAHLRDGAPLPESQVVRTTPRQRVDAEDPDEPGATRLLDLTEADNLPPIEIAPAPDAAIRFTGDRVVIPD